MTSLCKRLTKSFVYIFFIFLGLTILRISLFAQAPVFPKGTNLTSFTVITDAQIGNDSQKIMLATLQGIVARRSSSQIYIDIPGLGYSTLKNHLRDHYGIPYTTQSNPWLLVQQYASLADGYILYNKTNANSINAATSLCGPLNAVAVDASIEFTANIFGLNNKLADVSSRDEGWVWTNYNSSFSRSNVVELYEYATDNLRDYATLANAFTFYDGNSAFRTNVMNAMDPDAACLGWGDSDLGEDKFVGPSSQRGVFTLAANWALNLSTFSSVRDPFVTQRTYSMPTTETNVHYVTFVATDGDNVEFDLNGQVNYFNHPARGSFSMGYGLSPSLADLAPSVLRWYFENASNGPNRDFFVTGVSGAGYMYPSMYPAAEFPLHAQKLNNFMARADLNIAQVLDFNSVGRIDLWNQYLAQPAMDALFYEEYSPYHGANGVISFATNGKPVIAARESLWGGLEEETNVIANVNAAVRDPSSALGYSLVCVHVWTKNLGNVQQVVTNLAADVRVVTPDEFAKLILQNVGRRLSFDFATGLQGWTTNKGSQSLDKAQWTSAEGGGALMLDGSDFGSPNTTRNAWSTRPIILPPNATTLSFDTRATGDGRLRVRMKDHIISNPPLTVLLDWDTPTSTNWVTRTVSLASYAGQTITLYFDQTDGGPSTNKARYVNNVAILTTGPALYAPATPRLFAPIVSTNTGVNLTWRINDTLADQFKIERQLVGGGAWSEIATVSGTTTNFADVPTIWGTNYLYRIRGSNTSGFGAYSNERDVITPPKAPTITTQPSSRTNLAGTTATFAVTASGSMPMSYQWRKNNSPLSNGGNISGATAETLTLANVSQSDAANYIVVINNSIDSVTSSIAALTVNVPPSITTQPQSQTVTAGTNVTFTVTASGTTPLSYQWRFNTTPIGGATASSYTRNNVQPSDAGNYSVVVTNIAGSTNSADAVLTVNVPPSVVTQPQNQTVIVGANVVMSVSADGSAPLSYKWRKNGSTLSNGGNVSGATTANLTLSSVTSTDAAGYSVVVTNVAGSTTSSSATLTVNVAPTATLTVQTTVLGATPNLLAYNSGHFLTNSNTRDWWRYAGVKGARIFISPSSIESTDDIAPVGDGVTDQNSFVARKAALRADPFNPAYINWSYFSNRYETVDLGSSGGTQNRIRVNYAAGELRKLGIQICAQMTVTQARFPIANSNDWANKWELWQNFYVGAFYLGRTFDVARYQMFNEPDHANANGLTQADYLQRLQLCSDAMQSALADVNSLYGKSLVPKFLAPVITTPSYNSWAQLAVTNRHLNFLGQTDSNFFLLHQYNYQQYNTTPSGFGANLASLRTSISNAMSPETPFPVSITEFNVHTAGEFDTMPDSLDYPSKYPVLGAIAVNLMQNGADELYNFKFSQTPGEVGDAYPNRKNGMHYVDNDNAPYNTGGITKAGEVWRLFNTAFAPGRNRLNTVKSSGASSLDVQSSYDPVAKRYYIFSANDSGSAVNLNLNLAALGLPSAGKVLLEEVSETSHGAGKFWTTVSAAQSTLGTQGANTVWLITISSEVQQAEQIVVATEDADVRDGSNKAINYGTNTTLTARNDPNSTANRSVAFIKFQLPTINFEGLQYAVLSLQASSATVSTTAQAHVYAITNNSWAQTALTWNNAPNLRSNVTNGVTISKQVVNGQGTEVSIVGQLVVSSTTASEKLIDVTSYLRTQSNNAISFLISQDPRWDVTLPSLAAGDTQPDGVKILSTESGSGPVLRLVFKNTAVNTPPVATNDNYIATEDTPLVVSAPGVLTNDFDADGNPLSAVLIGNPSNGGLTLNSDGGFVYTPASNFFGTDSFTYKANDGQALSGAATVFITVNPVNDDPVAANDNATTAQETPVVISVLVNDSDIDGGALSIQSFTQGASGSVSNNGNGTLTYTPDTGFVGSDNFNYTISDGLGGTDSATVNVTVTPPSGTPYSATLPVMAEAVVRGGVNAASDQDEVATGYLLIKYNALPFDSARKVYFQFDLAGLGADLNTQAVFTVTTHNPNFAQRAQLWALNQVYPTFTDTIAWNNAQANDTNSNNLLTNGALTATPIGASVFFSSATSTDYIFTIPRLGDYALSNRITLVFTGVDDAANSAGGLRLARTNATLQITAGVTSPAITAQPLSRTNNAGTEATFSVTATGTAPLNYQWRKGGTDLSDGGNISGATSATLTLANVLFADAANYSVVVSNGVGTATSSNAMLTVIDPIITAQPTSRTNSPGSTATFSVTAVGTAPLSYQWRKAGINLSNGGNVLGATSATLTLSGVTQSDATNYSVLVTNAVGSVLSSAAMLAVSGSTDVTPPSVAIIKPANNAHTNVAVVTISGTAKDAVPGVITAVKYRLLPETNFTFATITNGGTLTNWTTANVTLIPGTNIVHAYSIDGGGNPSPLKTNIFFYDLTSLLTVKIYGPGKVKTNSTVTVTNNQQIPRLVGRPFVLTAFVDAGVDYVFTNWTGGTNAGALTEVSTNPVYNFLMEQDLILQANFIPNPFTPAAGVYAGLFSDTNNGVGHRSAGFFKVTVRDKAAYSATFYFDGDTISGSGKFDLSGRASRSIARGKKGKVDVALFLELDWSAQQMRGTLSNGNWTSTLLGDKATFNATNLATGFVGTSTYLVPGTNNSLLAPVGFGYGLVTNNLLGVVSLNGGLADGAKTVQKVSLSKDGQWPLYVKLYKTTTAFTNLVTMMPATNTADYRGSLLGWVTFTNYAPTGMVTWIKTGTAATNYFYPGGFTSTVELLGSVYHAPSNGVRALNITVGTATFSSGNLAGPTAWSVTWASNNIITASGGLDKPTFTLTPKSGLLKGFFTHPQLGKTNFTGALLQDQNYSGGFFLSTNQTGKMRLE